MKEAQNFFVCEPFPIDLGMNKPGQQVISRRRSALFHETRNVCTHLARRCYELFDDASCRLACHNVAHSEEHVVPFSELPAVRRRNAEHLRDHYDRKRNREIGGEVHLSAPDRGVNALGAAHVALAAIHAQRETFRDDDHVRVHPIITRGGELVSVVPADVRMETFVRASRAEALTDAGHKVDRALRAGAQALGATLELTTLPGYLPLRADPALTELFRANAEAVVGAANVGAVPHVSGGTDMGDLSHLMPAIHPFSGGAAGTAHSADFLVTDYDVAVVNPAKTLALTAVDLLASEAREARRVVALHRPAMTRDAYLAYARSLLREERYRAEA